MTKATIKCTCCSSPITGIGFADHFKNVLVGVLCQKCYKAVDVYRNNSRYLTIAAQYLARIGEQKT